MEKENELNTQATDLSSYETDKEEISIEELEEFVSKLPSDNPRIRLFKRMFAFHVRVNKYHKEKQNS